MLVSIQWLKEYIDLSDIPLKDLRDKMSAIGLSVERQHSVGEGLEKIIIGEILTKEKHNDSDHLWVCSVNLGNGTVQIVTGAPNIFTGAKVPIISPGNVLPDGTKIEVTKLRGLESVGMMCSVRELGLGDDHEGIMILGNDATVGSSLMEYLGLPDVVFDVEVTSNRSDCLSMIGIARELSAVLNKPFKKTKTLSVGTSEQKVTIKGQVEDPSKCLRLGAALFDGFKLGDAPIWMQQRLLRAGMRPINNLVDITNYVMLEIGQPTHAYDATQIVDQELIVRNAKQGEKLQTLDKKMFDLTDEMLIIADKEKALGIAGIMGGQSSKITGSTSQLLLEVANFDPVTIRKTGMKLNIRTDAIVRFERGVDPELVPLALERINYLMTELTGSYIVSNVVDVYPSPLPKNMITLTSKKLTIYMGLSMELEYVERILNTLGFETIKKDGGNEEWMITVSVPSWRYRDASIEEDLIEEVARIYGYDNIPMSTPDGAVPLVRDSSKLKVKKVVLETLKSLRYQEVLTYSFTSKRQIEQSGYSVEEALEVASPLTEEHRYLRLSLLPNLLWIVHKNTVMGQDIHLFELSSVYHRRLFDILPDEAVSLAFEPLYLSGVIYDQEYSFENAYVRVQKTLSETFSELQITSVVYSQDQNLVKSVRTHQMFHPGRVGVVMIKDSVVGIYGEIHPKLADEWNLRQPVFMFELRFDPLIEESRLIRQYNAYSIYPATTEEVSFVMKETQNIGTIVKELYSVDSRIVSVQPFKPYTGDQIERGTKAVTISFVYQSQESSIKDSEAVEIRNKITKYMEEKFAASVRR
jgi:phenylalanyl-tRNA synthetase beta chain